MIIIISSLTPVLYLLETVFFVGLYDLAFDPISCFLILACGVHVLFLVCTHHQSQ